MKVLSSVLILVLFAGQLWSQENQVTIRGKVADAKTKVPLANATVEVKGLIMELITNLDGEFKFEVPAEAKNDSLTISHIGYKTFRKRIGDIHDVENIFLSDYSVELRAITITSRTLRLKEIDKFLKPIRGNLYAYETETTVGLYNLFLDYLEEHGQPELLKQCNYDLSGYDEKMKAFFTKEYNAPYQAPQNKKDTTVKNYSDFPAVNISHGAATVFCRWLTEQYNIDSGKKKFKKVKFRLPTLKEWQIAALGYAKFQSWNLTENKVEVIIPADTFSVVLKGNTTSIPVNHEILYPWWNHYNYRKKVQNQKGCFLGNFKIPAYMIPCNSIPGKDGWTKMSQTATYFPNNIGLSDVVGNVAEMIDERGKACGGSWDDLPEASTIHSVKSYRKPDGTVGFRLFMEVIEE